MKKPVFKVGDQVTYKCKNDLPYGYVYGGNDIGGHVGEIIDILEYNSEHGCYEIEVTADCDEASCDAYSLLEFEVLEYDTIVESMSEDEDIDTDEDIDDEDGLSDEEENELYNLGSTHRQFQVGDTVYIKKCDDYRYQNNSDIEKYYGKPGVVVYNANSEYLSKHTCYDLEIGFDDVDDGLWFLECELTKTEIQGESIEEVKKPSTRQYPDISNTLTDFDHFFKVKSPLTDLFQQYIEEFCGVDSFLEGVDIDYIREEDDDIKEITDVFTGVQAFVFIDLPFYEDFEVTRYDEDRWSDLLHQYEIGHCTYIEHNRYSELLSKSKTLTCETDEIFVVSTKTESTAQISEDNREDQFFANTTSTKIFNF